MLSFCSPSCRLRRKQNKYPVLFLTNGDTLHYTPMLDLRERTNQMAIGSRIFFLFYSIDQITESAARQGCEPLQRMTLVRLCKATTVFNALRLKCWSSVSQA